MQFSTRSFMAALVLAGALGSSCGALAADNSGIVILDQQDRSTPYGEYHSQSRTQVFGPSSGYRYEEYSTPGVIVYPGHNGYGGTYGRYPGSHGHGRVIEQYGSGAYGRYGAAGAPAAPGIYGYSNPYRNNHIDGRHRRPDDRRDHGRYRSYDDSRGNSGFGRDPSQRAIEPAQRAIQPSRRAMDH